MSDLFLLDSLSGCTRFLSRESLSENKSNIFVFEVFISFIANHGVESICDSFMKSSSSDFSGDHAESGYHVEPHEVVANNGGSITSESMTRERENNTIPHSKSKTHKSRTHHSGHKPGKKSIGTKNDRKNAKNVFFCA